jgi:hypothetical protein
MLLVPKFSKFINLSIHAFIHHKCLQHCIYLSIVCLHLDFQEKVFEEPEVFFSEQQGKCPTC